MVRRAGFQNRCSPCWRAQSPDGHSSSMPCCTLNWINGRMIATRSTISVYIKTSALHLCLIPGVIHAMQAAVLQCGGFGDTGAEFVVFSLNNAKYDNK